ncbi:hypothetical protein Emag_007146 [Eimeria magna]
MPSCCGGLRAVTDDSGRGISSVPKSGRGGGGVVSSGVLGQAEGQHIHADGADVLGSRGAAGAATASEGTVLATVIPTRACSARYTPLRNSRREVRPGPTRAANRSALGSQNPTKRST